MKLMFASDIHGDEYYCKKLKKLYKEENSEKLILLGDLLYNKSRMVIGRNAERQRVAGILNDLSEDIICVKGNCDTDMDQDLLYFPMLKEISFATIRKENYINTWTYTYSIYRKYK